MAFNYGLQRQSRPQQPVQAPQVNRYALTRQAPLSQNAQLADDQNLKGLQTGQFADVQSAQGATDRANALRTTQSLQAARGLAARSGEMSPEAAMRGQDQAFASAEAQNLNASNGVNQMQRQYRQDAINQSGAIGARDSSAANSERAYQTGADQEQYNRFGLERANAQQQAQLGVTNNQWDKSFGANREDAATAKSQFGQTFAAGREDAATAKNQFGESLAQRQQEFGVTSGQSQQQINNQAGQYLQSLNQRDKEFGVTSGQNQQQINNQKDQFGVTSGQNQQQINNQASQFGVTSGQNQQQIDNQKDQFGQTRADANNKFDLTRADSNSQFGVTSGQNQQQIDNQNSQFGQTRTDANNKFDLTRADQNSQFGVTSGQTQQQINAQAGNTTYQRTMDQINAIQDPKARQAAMNTYSKGGDVSQFITGSLYDSAGGLNKPFQSASPGTQAYQAKADELHATYPDKSPAEINKMVQDQTQQDQALSRAPADAATKAASAASVKDKLAQGQPLTPEDIQVAKTQGVIPAFNSSGGGAASITGAEGAQKYLQDHPDGNLIIDGKDVQVVSGGRYSSDFNSSGGMLHKNFTQLKVDGKDYWLNQDGLWYDKNPVSMEYNGRLTGDHGSIPSPIKK